MRKRLGARIAKPSGSAKVLGPGVKFSIFNVMPSRDLRMEVLELSDAVKVKVVEAA